MSKGAPPLTQRSSSSSHTMRVIWSGLLLVTIIGLSLPLGQQLGGRTVDSRQQHHAENPLSQPRRSLQQIITAIPPDAPGLTTTGIYLAGRKTTQRWQELWGPTPLYLQTASTPANQLNALFTLRTLSAQKYAIIPVWANSTCLELPTSPVDDPNGFLATKQVWFTACTPSTNIRQHWQILQSCTPGVFYIMVRDESGSAHCLTDATSLTSPPYPYISVSECHFTTYQEWRFDTQPSGTGLCCGCSLQVPTYPFPAQPIQSKSLSTLYINVDAANPMNVVAITTASPLNVMFIQEEGNLYKLMIAPAPPGRMLSACVQADNATVNGLWPVHAKPCSKSTSQNWGIWQTCNSNFHAFINQMTGMCLGLQFDAVASAYVVTTMVCGSYPDPVLWSLATPAAVQSAACCNTNCPRVGQLGMNLLSQYIKTQSGAYESLSHVPGLSAGNASIAGQAIADPNQIITVVNLASGVPSGIAFEYMTYDQTGFSISVIESPPWTSPSSQFDLQLSAAAFSADAGVEFATSVGVSTDQRWKFLKVCEPLPASDTKVYIVHEQTSQCLYWNATLAVPRLRACQGSEEEQWLVTLVDIASPGSAVTTTGLGNMPWYIDCCAGSFGVCQGYIKNEYAPSAYFAKSIVGPPAGTYACSYAEGSFTAARFRSLSGMGISPDGETIYVGDDYDFKIRAIDRTTQTTRTVVGSGTSGYAESSVIANQRVYRVRQMAVSPIDNQLYFADSGNNVVRTWNPTTGATALYAGSPNVYANADGNRLMCRFGDPQGLVIDRAGNVYVADTAFHVIKIINISTGMCTTIAGTGTSGFNGDGPALSTQLNGCIGLAINPITQELYFADTVNRLVRKLVTNTTGTFVATVAGNNALAAANAGNYEVASDPTAVAFSAPDWIAFHPLRAALLISDGGVRRVHLINEQGTLLHVAWSGTSGDVEGPPNVAQTVLPVGIVVDQNGGVFQADFGRCRVNSLNVFTTPVLVEASSSPVSTTVPTQLMTNVFVPSTNITNSLASAGVQATTVPKPTAPGYSGPLLWNLAGATTSVGFVEGALSSAKFANPLGICQGPGKSLVVVDKDNARLRSVNLTSRVTSTIVGSGTKLLWADGSALQASLNVPGFVLWSEDNGRLIWSEPGSNSIRGLDLVTNQVQTFAGQPSLSAGFADGDMFSTARFSEPMGIAALSGSVLLVADRGNNRVRAVLGDQHMVVTLVGQGAVELLQTSPGAVPGVWLGPAPSVQISRPMGLALMHDGSGVFISEATRVLFFSFITGNVSVVAGPGALPGATLPALKTPTGLAWSSTLGLFIADAGANQVFQLSPQFDSLKVVAGSGLDATSFGPALQAGLSGPTDIMFNPFNSSLIITDSTGLRQLTLDGFIPDPPVRYIPLPLNLTAFMNATAAAITTALATTVAAAVTTSITMSVAAGSGGAVAGAVASSGAGGVVSGASISLLGSVQFLALTSGTSANMTDLYRGLGCSLGWSNFQFNLLGGQRPHCTSAQGQPASNATGTRRALLSAVQQWAGRTLLQQDPAPDPSWYTNFQAVKNQFALSIYDRLIVVGCAIAATVLLHWAVLCFWRWKWPNGERVLPSLLVFPRPELIVLLATVVGMSEAFGILVSTDQTEPVAISVLVGLYVFSMLLIVVFITYTISRVKEVLPDRTKEAENDLIFRGAAYVRRITLAQMKQPQTIRHDLKDFDASQLSEGPSRPSSAQSEGGKKVEPRQSSEAEPNTTRQEPYRTQHYLKQGMALAPLGRLVWTMAKELKEDISDIAHGARREFHHMLTSSIRRIQPEPSPTGSAGPRSRAGLLSSGRQAAVAESQEGPEDQQPEQQERANEELPHDKSPHEMNEPLTRLVSQRLKTAPSLSDAAAPASAGGRPLRLSHTETAPSDAVSWQEGQRPSEDAGLDDPKWLVKKEINDRLGPLFEENRSVNRLTITFCLAMVAENIVCGVLCGVQEGLGVHPGSAASIGLNCTLMAIKLSYCAYLLILRPQVSLTLYLVESISAALETAAAACLVVLQFYSDLHWVQIAMMWLELALLIIQLTANWITIAELIRVAVQALRDKRSQAKPLGSSSDSGEPVAHGTFKMGSGRTKSSGKVAPEPYLGSKGHFSGAPSMIHDCDDYSISRPDSTIPAMRPSVGASEVQLPLSKSKDVAFSNDGRHATPRPVGSAGSGPGPTSSAPSEEVEKKDSARITAPPAEQEGMPATMVAAQATGTSRPFGRPLRVPASMTAPYLDTPSAIDAGEEEQREVSEAWLSANAQAQRKAELEAVGGVEGKQRPERTSTTLPDPKPRMQSTPGSSPAKE